MPEWQQSTVYLRYDPRTKTVEQFGDSVDTIMHHLENDLLH